MTKHENIFKNYRQYKNLHQEDGETTTEYQRRREEIGAKLQNDGIDMNDTLVAIDFMDPETIIEENKNTVSMSNLNYSN